MEPKKIQDELKSIAEIVPGSWVGLSISTLNYNGDVSISLFPGPVHESPITVIAQSIPAALIALREKVQARVPETLTKRIRKMALAIIDITSSGVDISDGLRSSGFALDEIDAHLPAARIMASELACALVHREAAE